MSEFFWIVTKDHLTNPEDDKSRTGFGHYDRALLAQPAKLKEAMPFRFKLYDDDGVLYYSGRTNDITSQAAFRPLDWAMADAGATEIRVSENGRTYETL